MTPRSPQYGVVTTPTPNEANGKTAEKPRSKLVEYMVGMPGIIAGAALGILIGVLIQRAKPSAELVSWIGIPGDLFIRALRCIIPPLVFCTIVAGMGDMYVVGKAGAIGWRAFFLYTFTTLVATTEGLLAVIIFRPMFSSQRQTSSSSTVPEFSLQCSEPGFFLSAVNGTVSCLFDETFNSTKSYSAASKFVVTDINSVFATTGSRFAQLTLSESLQAQLKSMVTDNITSAFANGALLSVIMFAIPFGIAVAILPRGLNQIANFINEVNLVFMSMITWVIMLTPIAIVSLLSKSISGQKDLGVLASDVGLFVLCTGFTLVIHVVVFYPLLMRAFVNANPFAWLRKMAKAQIFAFSCASSMATLPITMECIEKTGEVSATIYRFVLSLGATINMDGTAIYFPIAIVFMAEAEGLGNLIGGVEMFMIVLISTIGAVGTAPVPSAGIVMTMTIWQSVLSGQPLPSSFAYIIATDWILDRFKTCVNVTGDTVITRIVAESVGKEINDVQRESVASAMDDYARDKAQIRAAVDSTANNA